MDTRQLAYFVAVYEQRSISAAREDLNVKWEQQREVGQGRQTTIRPTFVIRNDVYLFHRRFLSATIADLRKAECLYTQNSNHISNQR